MKRKWYHHPALLCVLFALWFLIVPAILGIVLLRGSIKEDVKNYNQINLDRQQFEEEMATQRDDQQSFLESEKRRIDAELSEAMSKCKAELSDAESKIKNTKGELHAAIDELDYYCKEVKLAAVSISSYDGLRSDEVKNELSMLQTRQNAAIKNESCLIHSPSETMSKSAFNNQKKQILRCFNAECTHIIDSITAKNVDACRAKIQKAFEINNKLFTYDGVQLSSDFLQMKLDELSLIYAYQVKIENEKEIQKEIRAQMMEEEKVRREIEREKLKIEKEEAQFSNEIQKLIAYMQKTDNDIEKQLYIDKVRELEERLKALELDKQNVLEREQNTRAGFVYIISNIGAFGEDIYKIGMTRRLEPMDRISELSSASVPFPFDVHAMIFSSDAPGLETILHQAFRDMQVNKVNPRKEFFKVELEAIKKIVLENHNATVHFIDNPEAMEYRETLRIATSAED